MITEIDIARLQKLLHQSCENGHMCLTVALEWNGDGIAIKPFVLDPPMYALPYQDWQTISCMVDEWYSYTSDEAIACLNAQVIAAAEARTAQQSAENDKPDSPTPGWIYILEGGGFYKIGKTTHLLRRIAQIEPRLPFAVELLWYTATDDMDRLETDLHEQFASQRTNGEWFLLTDRDIDWIKAYAENH